MTFEQAVRQYLDLKPEDHYWDDPGAALDHESVESLNELAKWFFDRGWDAGRARGNG